ncbi:hypothetical protein ABIB57_005343 [Devosia sp. UYZn731]
MQAGSGHRRVRSYVSDEQFGLQRRELMRAARRGPDAFLARLTARFDAVFFRMIRPDMDHAQRRAFKRAHDGQHGRHLVAAVHHLAPGFGRFRQAARSYCVGAELVERTVTSGHDRLSKKQRRKCPAVDAAQIGRDAIGVFRVRYRSASRQYLGPWMRPSSARGGVTLRNASTVIEALAAESGALSAQRRVRHDPAWA